MEIIVLVVLFLVGTVGGAVQAMRYLERRQSSSRKQSKPGHEESD
jgi:uncharacterized protein YneF (UPF0154 family)